MCHPITPAAREKQKMRTCNMIKTINMHMDMRAIWYRGSSVLGTERPNDRASLHEVEGALEPVVTSAAESPGESLNEHDEDRGANSDHPEAVRLRDVTLSFHLGKRRRLGFAIRLGGGSGGLELGDFGLKLRKEHGGEPPLVRSIARGLEQRCERQTQSAVQAGALRRRSLERRR